MIITKEEMMRRLKSDKNILNQVVNNPSLKNEIRIVPIDEGKRTNTPQIKEEPVRILAGVIANECGISETARQLGLTNNQVRSARDSEKPTIKEARSAAMDRIRDLAVEKLMMSFGLMTEDKFENANLRDITSAAMNLSKIVTNVSPKEEAQTNVQIVIYAPEVKQEKAYRVIEV